MKCWCDDISDYKCYDCTDKEFESMIDQNIKRKFMAMEFIRNKKVKTNQDFEEYKKLSEEMDKIELMRQEFFNRAAK